MMPSAWPDGKAVDVSEISAVPGRGRSLRPLAAAVTNPISMTVAARNTAIRRFRRLSAMTIPTSATMRIDVGLNTVDTATQNAIQLGRPAP